MKRNPILYILLAILIVQPLLVVGFGPSMTTNAIHAEDTAVPAQGTRLAPEAHTAHVPIIIDGNADFVTQGWPGSGTPSSPYIIAGLNITYDLGINLIQIHNADVSFVIRDCYIGQLSIYLGIELINTTDAIVEYTSIYSNGGGIYGLNANNTEVRDSHIETYTGGTGPHTYVVSLDYSQSCLLENNVFNSTNWRNAWFTYCPDLTSTNNAYYGNTGWYALTFTYCNDTSLTSDILDTGFNPRFQYSHGISVVDCTMSNLNTGIQLLQSPGASITGTTIQLVEGDFGVQISSSNYTEVSDCTIEGPVDSDALIFATGSQFLTITGNIVSDSLCEGMYLSAAHNSTINSNTIADCTDTGIFIGNSHDCEVSSNIISGSNDNGIQVSTSHRIAMDGNDVSDIGTNGIYVQQSDNGTLSNSVVDEISNIGIYLDDCENWQINDNTVSNADQGIALSAGAFTDIWSNDVSDIGSEGISVDSHGVLETWENTVTNAATGLYYTDCDDLYIRDEVVSECTTGIHVDSSEESEFSNNMISDCTDIGINVDTVANTSFILNTLTNCEPYGFYIRWGLNLTFTDNVLTRGGFYLSIESSLSDVNHTFSGNTVNDLPLYYGKSAEDLDIDGTSYGQIILVNCSDSEITGGSFILTATIFLHTCENVNISDVTITDHIFGIAMLDSESINVWDSTITGNYDWSDVGIFVGSSDNFTAENVDIMISEVCIVVGGSDFALIDSCTLTDAEVLIVAENSDLGIVSDCELYYAGAGIYIMDAAFWNISRNHIYWCEDGIRTENVGIFNVSFNEIHDCFVGIHWIDSYISLIYNNTVRWNYGGLIMEDGSQASVVYNNIIALNFLENGYDDDYDGWNSSMVLAIGNYWDDYSGTGTYSISGMGGSIDYYPMQYIVTEPIINEPWDESYPEGDTGNEVYWYVYDDYLNTYTVTVDGDYWSSGTVSDLYYDEIVVGVDGLPYGDHTVEITVWDVDMNSVSDSVLIDVWDNTD
ncbi:MAG: right-handed parallel beta-helix repeat-containing protein, partial [Candidatus Thorarchaeota archaeon]